MDADDLYGLPLDRFVTERGVLAKSLRAGGRRGEATAVAALRRPSISAWAVNQLVRTQHAAVQELFEAGDELREAQSALLAGSGDARALRAAGERERAAVDALVDAARGLLTSQGGDLSATTIERVSDTLHAAALDESTREQVREGRLERELRHVGLGIGEGAAAAFAPAQPAPKKARATKRRAPGKAKEREDEDGEQAESTSDRRRREAQERAEAEDAKQERAAARTAARAAEAKAQRHAQAAARALQSAEKRRDEAAAALTEAQDAVAQAREDASLAEEGLHEAQAALQRALRDP